MGYWSEKLRFRAFHRRTYYDLFNAGLLVLMAVLVLPAWKRIAGESDLGVGHILASAWLPAALGFLLALRYGTVDLSVWVVMGVGGTVAAGIINLSVGKGEMMPPPVMLAAVLAAVAAGALVGGANAVILSRLRLPGFIVTGLVGLIAMGVLHVVVRGPTTSISDAAFDPYVLWISELLAPTTASDLQLEGPLTLLRMLMVFCAWAVVLVVLMIADARTSDAPRPFARWWVRSAALCASGALSALSGVAWLIDQGRTPIPTRLVDGLTIPVSVMLAGAILLRGRGRTMLAGVFLPVSLLLVNLWEWMVWPATFYGYPLPVLALGMMIVVAQLAYMWGLDHPKHGRWLSWLAGGLSGLGLVLLASSAQFRHDLHKTMILASLVVWAIGAALLLFTVLRARRRGNDDFDAYEDDEDKSFLPDDQPTR